MSVDNRREGLTAQNGFAEFVSIDPRVGVGTRVLVQAGRLPDPLLKLSSRFGWKQVSPPGTKCSSAGLGRRVGRENEEGKKRAQPGESSFVSGLFGCEACFLFSSADSVPPAVASRGSRVRLAGCSLL